MSEVAETHEFVAPTSSQPLGCIVCGQPRDAAVHQTGEASEPIYYGFDLDDSWDEMWHEVERIQDGGANHHVAFKQSSPHDAAMTMALRLVPFIEKKMYESDEDGRPIETEK